MSKVGLGDDIDKTIAAFLLKRMQSDTSAFSDPATAGELAVPVDTPLPKTKRKGDKVKLGATVTRQKPNRVESMEMSGAEASIVGEVNRRATERGPNFTPKLNVAAGEPGGSQSGSKLGSATLTSCPACLGTVVHPLADCPVVQGGPDSIESRIGEMESGPGFAPSSEIITSLRRFAEKARSKPPDSRINSPDVEPSRSRVPVPSVALYRRPSTGAKPKIPKGHEISEVRVEARGEGSSSDSSSEGEDDGDNPVPPSIPVNTSSVHLHVEDQLVPSLHGSAKRGPRRSVLDEIPTSSETEESKSSSEDLVLDEEEDLSPQPSHKRRKLSITRPSSIEPELTSEDEEDLSVPVYMDTSQVCFVQFRGDLTQKLTNSSIKFPLSAGLGMMNP